MVTELMDPVEQLVRTLTDAPSLAGLLARENPPVIDCRSGTAGYGRDQFRRDLLADIYDNLSTLRGSRNADGSFKRADRCGDDGTSGVALDCILEPTKDAELSGLRYAWLIACRLHCGMSELDALAEVRELEHVA